MRIFISIFRKIIVLIIIWTAVLFLWVVSVQIGGFGGDAPNLVLFHIAASDVLLQALYGATELLISVTFFISLSRQLLPRGIKQIMIEEPITLAEKVRYLPSVFALGVITGLAFHGFLLLAKLFH